MFWRSFHCVNPFPQSFLHKTTSKVSCNTRHTQSSKLHTTTPPCTMNANNSVARRLAWQPRTIERPGKESYTAYTTLPVSKRKSPPYAEDPRKKNEKAGDRMVTHNYMPYKYYIPFKKLAVIPAEFSISTIQRVEMLWPDMVFEKLTWRIVPFPDSPQPREFYVRMRDVETVYKHTPKFEKLKGYLLHPAELDGSGFHFCQSKYSWLPDFCLELVADPRVWGPCLPTAGSPQELVVEIELFDEKPRIWKAPRRQFSPTMLDRSTSLREVLVIPACEAAPWWEAPATPPTPPTPSMPTAPPTTPMGLSQLA